MRRIALNMIMGVIALLAITPISFADVCPRVVSHLSEFKDCMQSNNIFHNSMHAIIAANPVRSYRNVSMPLLNVWSPIWVSNYQGLYSDKSHFSFVFPIIIRSASN